MIAAFVSFVTGISVVMVWLNLGNISIKPSIIDKVPNISNATGTELPQNDTSDSPSVSNKTVSLPCDDSDADRSQPWVRRSEILDSFPPVHPLPKFIGTFRDKNWNYMIDIYRDSEGVFGEISSPVLEADSPTSRLYDVTFDSFTGSLQFSTSPSISPSPSLGSMQFSGFLHSKFIKGKFTQNDYEETVTLKKLKTEDDFPYNSRSQFDCAMKLFGRW